MRYLMYMPKPDCETSKPEQRAVIMHRRFVDHIPINQDRPAER